MVIFHRKNAGAAFLFENRALFWLFVHDQSPLVNSETVQDCPENHASFEFERRRKMEVTSGRLCKAEKPTTTALLYHTTLAYFVH